MWCQVSVVMVVPKFNWVPEYSNSISPVPIKFNSHPVVPESKYEIKVDFEDVK